MSPTNSGLHPSVNAFEVNIFKTCIPKCIRFAWRKMIPYTIESIKECHKLHSNFQYFLLPQSMEITCASYIQLFTQASIIKPNQNKIGISKSMLTAETWKIKPICSLKGWLTSVVLTCIPSLCLEVVSPLLW